MKEKIIYIITPIFAFFIGVVGTVVVFNNTNTNLASTNIQAAIKELDTKSNTWINPSVLNGKGYYTNSARSMIATSNGILLIRNGDTHFIKSNNWAEEQNHIKQVFPNTSCQVTSSNVSCSSVDFYCYVSDRGYVSCRDISAGSSCDVYSSGNVSCD